MLFTVYISGTRKSQFSMVRSHWAGFALIQIIYGFHSTGCWGLCCLVCLELGVFLFICLFSSLQVALSFRSFLMYRNVLWEALVWMPGRFSSEPSQKQGVNNEFFSSTSGDFESAFRFGTIIKVSFIIRYVLPRYACLRNRLGFLNGLPWFLFLQSKCFSTSKMLNTSVLSL